MTEHPLPSSQMFVVHAEVVHRTQRYWAIHEATRKFQASMNATIQATISSLAAVKRFAEALAKLKSNKGDET